MRDGASGVMLLLEVGAMLLRDGTAHESWREQGWHHMLSRRAGVPSNGLHHDIRPSKQALPSLGPHSALGVPQFLYLLTLSQPLTGPLQARQDATSLSTAAWVSGSLPGRRLALGSRYSRPLTLDAG